MSLAHTPTTEIVASRSTGRSLAEDFALAAIGSALMALCAHISFPLLFSPVPLTLQTFGLLLIAFTMGPQRAFAAMTLYLIEGAAGLPVFSPASASGPGGIAHLIGPTGGFLMIYPFAAYAAGSLFSIRKNIAFAYVGAITATALFLTSGLIWFKFVMHVSFGQAFAMAVAPFLPGEIIKIVAASFAGERMQKLLARFQ
jgi:biotin transport system substrate-specific component